MSPSPSADPGPNDAADEPRDVRDRYARRAAADPRYNLLTPAAMLAWQERQRALARMLVRSLPRVRTSTASSPPPPDPTGSGLPDLSSLALIEVGSGSGGNLLDFLRMGFAPERLAGIELLPERHDAARRVLPQAVRLQQGDACALLPGDASIDIVLQSTVFSSLLDDAFQQRLADAMWATLRPGGAVLWYDFTVDNPRNRDVRGVPLPRIRQLFPRGTVTHRRVTLAPPLARAVVAVHPGLYTLFNALPALRTHLLCWIGKPDAMNARIGKEPR